MLGQDILGHSRQVHLGEKRLYIGAGVVRQPQIYLSLRVQADTSRPQTAGGTHVSISSQHMSLNALWGSCGLTSPMNGFLSRQTWS